MTDNLDFLNKKSLEYRKTILEIIYNSGAGHTGGSLSCVEILNVLYNVILDKNPNNFHQLNRDHYIHSKGHSVEALYTILCDKGFFSKKELSSLNNFNSHFIGHPTKKINGIEQNTGALGHGLSVAVGLALSQKIDKISKKVFTLLGDGELSEGSVWEACLTAQKYMLDNLVVIVDHNNLQTYGSPKDVAGLSNIKQKMESFGFKVKEVNGHSIKEIRKALKYNNKKKPLGVICKTVKGKGIDFAEDKLDWHHKANLDDLTIKNLKNSLNKIS